MLYLNVKIDFFSYQKLPINISKNEVLVLNICVLHFCFCDKFQ